VAVIGHGGIVELNREWAAPTIVDSSRITGGINKSLDLVNLGFWSGDKVYVAAERGVPFDTNQDGFANCPDGHAFYPDGLNEKGPALTQRTATGSFYGNDNTRPFYENLATRNQLFEVFIHRNSLDNALFYSSEVDAINGGTQGLIPLRQVDFGKLIIAVASPEQFYKDFLLEQASIALETEGADEIELEPLPPSIENLVNDPSVRGWKQQGSLTQWIFEMDAAQLDQNAIGDAFGEYAKGMLKGSGSFSALLSHETVAGQSGSSDLLKLLLLTARGAKAKAKFLMSSPANNRSQQPNKNSLYYSTDILFWKTEVNTADDDLIRMSAEFIATGAIKIVVGEEVMA
jgi:hypothetical protein